MRLAVLKERRTGEARVAATPDTVKKLIGLGLSVAVEAGAGLTAAISDAEFAAAGAEIAPDAQQLLRTLNDRAVELKVTVERVKTFAGPVTVHLTPQPGLELPETVVIQRGEAGVEVEVRAEAGATFGRRGVNLSATADVDGFEEEQRGGRFEIDVVKRAVRLTRVTVTPSAPTRTARRRAPDAGWLSHLADELAQRAAYLDDRLVEAAWARWLLPDLARLGIAHRAASPSGAWPGHLPASTPKWFPKLPCPTK